MILTVKGKSVAIKEDSSFEFISENRLFTDADEYTLNIDIPLKDCPNNIEIFGNINRKDAASGELFFEAQLQDENFIINGAVVITSISEVEVKVQFVANRSYQNFYPQFDKLYINELNLGEAPRWLPNNLPNHSQSNIYKSCSEAWSNNNNDYVALPWINSYSGNMQNACKYNSTTRNYEWKVVGDDDDDLDYSTELTLMPYLIYITKRICDAVGYDYDFTCWENSPHKYLLVCNVLPSAWNMREFNKILPKWSVSEYFKELEKLLGYDFDINHFSKKISCEPIANKISNAGTVVIENVVNEFSIEVTTNEAKSEYRGAKNYGYAKTGHRLNEIYNCNWYIEKNRDENGNVVRNEFANINALLNSSLPAALVEDAGGGRGDNTYPAGKWGLSYVIDIDKYFIPKVVERVEYRRRSLLEQMSFQNWGNVTELQAVNLFGPLIKDKEREDDIEEIKIVPACIDVTDTENGKMLFVDCGEMSSGEDISYGKTHARHPGAETVDNDAILQFGAAAAIEKGEDDSDKSYFDNIFVAYWIGSYTIFIPQLPHPWVDNVETKYAYEVRNRLLSTGVLAVTWSILNCELNVSLRINNPEEQQYPLSHEYLPIIKERKYSFSFIADEIPNVMAVYYIQGKKYLCEKITANFTKNGMSKLLKGTFFLLENQ